MKFNRKWIWIIMVMIAATGIFVILYLYNCGLLGYGDCQCCLKKGPHNSWMCFAQDRINFFSGRGIVVGISIFILIISGYFIARFLIDRKLAGNNLKVKGNCPSCSKEYDEKWKICPYCGKKLL